ncbi:hypothetical protein ACOICT_29110, partial [Klebsiella pneumoniae]|uniref:hypothetical protein n=1 Tax=Klebsiella pneumoniae TaxID=573 RepID=UPI003B5BE716
MCTHKHRDLFPADVILKYNWDTMHNKDFATLQHLEELPERKVIKAPGAYYNTGELVEYTAVGFNHMPRKLKEFEH